MICRFVEKIFETFTAFIQRYPPHSIMNFRILFTRVFLRTFILIICIALQFTDLLKNVIFANNQEACIAAEGLLKEFYPLRVFPAAFSTLLLNEGIPRAYRGKKLRLKNILFFPSKSEGITCRFWWKYLQKVNAKRPQICDEK